MSNPVLSMIREWINAMPPEAQVAVGVGILASVDISFDASWPEEHRVAVQKAINAAREARRLYERDWRDAEEPS